MNERDRGFITDRAVRSFLIVVSTPSLAFSARIVEAHEPVRVEAFPSELAVEGFDERIVGGLAGTREVECHTTVIGPEIQIAGHELGALIHPYSLRVSELTTNPFEHLDDIGTAEGEPGLDGR